MTEQSFISKEVLDPLFALLREITDDSETAAAIATFCEDDDGALDLIAYLEEFRGEATIQDALHESVMIWQERHDDELEDTEE